MKHILIPLFILSIIFKTSAQKIENVESAKAEILFTKGEKQFQNGAYEKAYRSFQKSAEKGNLNANYWLSLMHYSGQGAMPDYKKAVEIINQTGESLLTSFQLMKYHDLGITRITPKNSIKKDGDNAEALISWLKERASLYNIGHYYYVLGYIYNNGKIISKDNKAALEYYLKAVELNNAVAASNIGHLYATGDGVEQNSFKAVSWYEKALVLDKKNYNAMLNLALEGYLSGKVYNKNVNQAKELVQLALDVKFPKAYAAMASIEADGELDSLKVKKASSYFDQGAALGDASSLEKKAEMLLAYGDIETALKAYEKYAEHAPQYYLYLGNFYRNGEYIESDINKAFEYYDLAIENGIANGYYEKAFCYDWGYGVIIDWKKAFELYTKAYNMGSVEAKTDLGEFYAFGLEGLKQDLGKAIELWEEAAKEGSGYAKLYLDVLNDIQSRNIELVQPGQYDNLLSYDDDINTLFSGFPLILNTDERMFSLDLNYKMGDSDMVQIWPAYENQAFDHLKFLSYSPCPELTNKEGTYTVSLGLGDNQGGYRGIGYAYYDAYFSWFGITQERLRIKIPAMVCWKPI